MKSIDIFYQGEGIGEIAHIEIEPDVAFADLKTILIEKHGAAHGTLLFLEDEDEPLDESILIKDRASPKGLKVHVHHCRHVEVTVTFNGETVEHRFPPSATVARVKRWAAEKKFGMSEDEAGEHVLQIAGTHDRPAPGMHIGSLTEGKICNLAFDLVPDERVNGAAEYFA
ncbi:hypothetical protein ELI03_34705 [Rhizobium leguminosarum]|uniref:Uncharacterized protein n=1 Tax=Rhizobium leguminosarum TaxID=384 RepID=A0A4Q8XP04_RHILE|nr:hypothetical protein [Rhizobium leguminosarum]TAX64409.1 hypothetical protein ELI03_34705 [Rhizobium leguminosarum]